MCEANAFLIENDDHKLIMEAVDSVEPHEDGVRLSNIFGEQKFLPHPARTTHVGEQLFSSR